MSELPFDEMSFRLSKCLKNAGILTFEDLENYTVNDILHIPNLGRKSLNELVNMKPTKNCGFEKINLLVPRKKTTYGPVPERLMSVYMLRIYNKFTYKKIGEMVGCKNDTNKPVTTERARQLFYRASKMIKNRIEKGIPLEGGVITK